MSTKVILPFEKEAWAICYHNVAFPLGIFQGIANVNKEDIVPWVIGRYINCSYDTNSPMNKYEMDLVDRWADKEGIMSYSSVNMQRDMYKFTYKKTIDFVKKAIHLGYYIYGDYNEKYIPGKQAYKKFDYTHDYFLYGYDDEKQVFFSIGFSMEQRYVPFEIPFESFYRSLKYCLAERVPIHMYKYNIGASFNLNLERIIDEISDYLNSVSRHNYDPKKEYGVKANRKLKEFWKKCVCEWNMSYIDIRYSRAYMEHKFFLNLCLCYLNSVQIICLKESDLEKVKLIYKKALLVHRLVLQFNCTKKEKIIGKIEAEMEWIEKVEMEIIPQVLCQLVKMEGLREEKNIKVYGMI